MDEEEVFWALVADVDFAHHVVSEIRRGHVVWQIKCSCGIVFSDRHDTAMDRQALHTAEIFAAA